MVHTNRVDVSPGGSSEAAPPVPIPNTVVKRFSAYDTALATEWENRSPPGGISTLYRCPLTVAPFQSTTLVPPATANPPATFAHGFGSHRSSLSLPGSAGYTLPLY